MKVVYTVMERWSNSDDLYEGLEQTDVIALADTYQKAKEIVHRRKDELVRLAHLSPSYDEETSVLKSEAYKGSVMISSEIKFVGLYGHIFDEGGIRVYSTGIDLFEYYIKKIEVES